MAFPDELGPRGRRMWDDSMATWELTPAHRVLFEEACQIADRLEDFNALLRESAGDFAACAPVLSESRQQSMALQRILAEVRQGARPLAAPQKESSSVASIADQVAKRRAKAKG